MTTYYGKIQRKLFVKLINGCFQTPVFYLNHHPFTNEKIELTFNLADSTQNLNETNTKFKSTNLEKLPVLNKLNKKPSLSHIYLVNADLLSQTIVDWDLWRPLNCVNKQTSEQTKEGKFNMSGGRKLMNSTSGASDNIWQHMFKILNKLLEDGNPAQIYHSSLFLKHGLLDKLMHFLLDANAENYLLDQDSCLALVNILKHFNSVFNNVPSSGSFSSGSPKPITKQLFSSFSDYLYILHSERNVYIVNQKNEFYFNLNLSMTILYVINFIRF